MTAAEAWQVLQESTTAVRGIMEFIRLHAPNGFDPALAEKRVNNRLQMIEEAFAAVHSTAESKEIS